MFETRIQIDRINSPRSYTGKDSFDLFLFFSKQVTSITFMILFFGSIYSLTFYGFSEILVTKLTVLFLCVRFVLYGIGNFILEKIGRIENFKTPPSWEKMLIVMSNIAFFGIVIIMVGVIFELLPIELFYYKLDISTSRLYVSDSLKYTVYLLLFMGFLPLITFAIMFLLMTFDAFAGYIINKIFPLLLMLIIGTAVVLFFLQAILTALNMMLFLLPFFGLLILITIIAAIFS